MAAPRVKDDLIFEEIGDTGCIIMNRAKESNAFNLPMVLSFNAIVEDWDKCKALVILKSQVPRIFGSGGDVLRVVEDAKMKKKIVHYYPRYGYTLMHTVASMKTPFVSLNNGLTMGGVSAICLHSKYFVCTEHTDFSMPENRIGHIPDSGSTYYLSRMKNHLGFYLALTGARIKGYDNVRAGIATHFCPAQRLPELERALLDKPLEVDAIITSYSTAPTNWSFSLDPYLQKINKIFNADTVEEIILRLEQDGSKWGIQTLEAMEFMCPLSLKATLHLLHRAKTSTLEECLQMEYVLANSFYGGANFIEGVQSRLRDKDNKPKWVPRSIPMVTSVMVENLYKVKPHMGPLSLRPKETISEAHERKE